MHQRSRYPPDGNGRFSSYNQGGGYNRGHSKQFYAPPLPPPPPPQVLPPQQNPKELLMAAGRLAAEYLVSKGQLPPSVLSRNYSSSGTCIPEIRNSPHELQQPAFMDEHRDYISPRGVNSGTDRRHFDDEYDYSRSRRNGFSGNRGKRKFGYISRREYSDWGRSKDRSGPVDRSRYSNSMEDDDDDRGAPGYRRERRRSVEVGSSISGPAAKGTVGDAESEDNSSKSSSSNTRKECQTETEDAVGERNYSDFGKIRSICISDKTNANEEGPVDNRENECTEVVNLSDEEVMNGAGDINKKIESGFVKLSSELDKVTNSEADASVNNNSNNNNAEESKQFSLSDEGIVNGENDGLNSNLDEAGLKDAQMDLKGMAETSDDEPADSESIAPNDCVDLMKLCDFGPVPKRSRSVTHRSTPADQSAVATTSGVELAAGDPPKEMMKAESSNGCPSNSQQTGEEDTMDCEENNRSTTAYINSAELKITEDLEAPVALFGSMEEDKKPELCITEIDGEFNLTFSSDSFSEPSNVKVDCFAGASNAKVETQQYGEMVVIDLADEDNPVENSSFHSCGDEGAVTLDNAHLDEPSSKTLDLNLAGTPEITEIAAGSNLVQHAPDSLTMGSVKNEEVCFDQSATAVRSLEVTETPDDTVLGQHNSAEIVMDPLKQEMDDITISVNTSAVASKYNHLPAVEQVVQVINIADSPIGPDVYDPSKPKEDMPYSGLGIMMNQGEHVDAMSSISDGYSIDFLGADMQCYPSMQTQLQDGIGLNVPEGMPSMDDPFYESLGDIGFMGVWDHQPTQEYEKFF